MEEKADVKQLVLIKKEKILTGPSGPHVTQEYLTSACLLLSYLVTHRGDKIIFSGDKIIFPWDNCEELNGLIGSEIRSLLE